MFDDEIVNFSNPFIRASGKEVEITHMDILTLISVFEGYNLKQNQVTMLSINPMRYWCFVENLPRYDSWSRTHNIESEPHRSSTCLG